MIEILMFHMGLVAPAPSWSSKQIRSKSPSQLRSGKQVALLLLDAEAMYHLQTLCGKVLRETQHIPGNKRGLFEACLVCLRGWMSLVVEIAGSSRSRYHQGGGWGSCLAALIGSSLLGPGSQWGWDADVDGAGISHWFIVFQVIVPCECWPPS